MASYFDYSDVPAEALQQLQQALLTQDKARAAFLRFPSAKTLEPYFTSMHNAQEMVNGLRRACFRTPAIVHIAGPVVPEFEETEGHEHKVQRCVRCGSLLLMWCPKNALVMTSAGVQQIDESQIDWWEEGVTVGKIQGDDASGEDGSLGYLIAADRALGSHETMCIGSDHGVLDANPEAGG